MADLHNRRPRRDHGAIVRELHERLERCEADSVEIDEALDDWQFSILSDPRIRYGEDR